MKRGKVCKHEEGTLGQTILQDGADHCHTGCSAKPDQYWTEHGGHHYDWQTGCR